MLKCCSKNKSQTTSASGRVVDGKLVLSLPDAIAPIVWQMDLNKTKASALEVLHEEETNIFNLSLKTPSGESVHIAKFDERVKAVEGLMAASHALENAHGQIRNAEEGQTIYTPAKPAKEKSGLMAIILKIFGVLFILLALFLLWGVFSMYTIDYDGTTTTQTSSTQANEPLPSNVPVSAEDYLSR